MKIVILGAGVIGVTSAYMLKKRGYDVTVIDRQTGSARECSFANGGQLSYCYHPMIPSPALIKTTIKWLGKRDAPLLFRFNADREMWRWVMRWLGQATWSKAEKNLAISLALGLYSRLQMHDIIAQEPAIDFDYGQKGHLHIFGDQKSLEAMAKLEAFKADSGVKYERLTAAECVAKEPEMDVSHVAGGLFNELDEAGDIHKFTEGLAGVCRSMGVKFMYDTTILDVELEADKIASVQTDKGDIEADSYVLALGSGSRAVGKKMGLDLPIYPLKGYSITVPNVGANLPRHSVTDQANKIVMTSFGDDLRVAGTVEFAGYDDRIMPHRIEMLKRMVAERYPSAVGHLEQASEWACLRPATPDGPPILGKSALKNLYFNTGHGTLGWTQAAGSAAILADIIGGEDAAIPLDGLGLGRF